MRAQKREQEDDAMAEVYSSGTWRANEGDEEGFVAAWTEFGRWVSEQPGVGTVRLARDLGDPGRYVSFAGWESPEHMSAWKQSDEFMSRLSKVREHVSEFAPVELEAVVALERGAPVSTG